MGQARGQGHKSREMVVRPLTLPRALDRPLLPGAIECGPKEDPHPAAGGGGQLSEP